MTQTQKHTPGPWHVCQNGIKEFIYAGDCRLLKAPGETIGEIEANARLIGAAPETAAERDRLKELNAELLAALKDVLGDKPGDLNDDYECVGCGRHYDFSELKRDACCPAEDCPRHNARAAIAKAEGR